MDFPNKGKIFYNYDPSTNVNGIGILSEGDVYSIDVERLFILEMVSKHMEIWLF